jgi:hypothetical protein
VIWLMTIAAMLLVSVIALAVFYYLIANFTKMGDFLHLKLPGLPPPKAQSVSLVNPAMTSSAALLVRPRRLSRADEVNQAVVLDRLDADNRQRTTDN